MQICGENADSAYAKLARAGIHISYFSSSAIASTFAADFRSGKHWS